MSIYEAYVNFDSMELGEVGAANVSIRDSIVSFEFELSAKLVSQISFVVEDPDFMMLNSNYFMIGRTVTFTIPIVLANFSEEFQEAVSTLYPGLAEDGVVNKKYQFEIAAITVDHKTRDTIRVEARTKAIQEMKRDKKPESFGRISPTQFASNMAARHGLTFFGESTPVDGNIAKEQSEQNDESTFDVLARLAREVEFMFFEANGVLFFASENYIIENQPSIEIEVPTLDENADLFAVATTVRKSADSKASAATFQTSLLKNLASITLFPGVGVNIEGLNNFDKTFMIDRVAFDGSAAGFVSISGTTPKDSDDMGCDLQTFQRGSRGECVKRIQQALNSEFQDGVLSNVTQRRVRYVINTTPGGEDIYAYGLSQAQIEAIVELGGSVVQQSYTSSFASLVVDGIFGPRTEAAVKEFQSYFGVETTGIVGPDTWYYIKNPDELLVYDEADG